jgi:hypothetical protein
MSCSEEQCGERECGDGGGVNAEEYDVSAIGAGEYV